MKLLVQKAGCGCPFIILPLDAIIRNISEQIVQEAGASFGTVETIELASASRLVDVPTANLPNGVIFAVSSVQDLFQLIKSPSAELFAAADGITIAQSVANPGQIWVRLDIGSERWRTQTTWFVDPINGHDEFVGSTLGTAIRSFNEFSRRMGPSGDIRSTIDITLTSDAPVTDKLYLRALSILSNAMIRVHGTPTILDSGTFTAVTDMNPATQTPPSVTDAAQAFGAYNNRRMRIVGGARDGAIAFISLIVSATQVRTSAWGINNVAAAPYSPNVTLVNPQIGDAYVIEDLPILRSFDFESSKTTQGTQGSEAILFESLTIGDSGNDRFSTGFSSNASLAKCEIALLNFYGRDQHIQLCNFTANHTFHISELTLRACLKKGGSFTLHHGASLFVRDHTMAQGVSLPTANNGAFVEIFDAAAFDSSTVGMIVDVWGDLRISGLLWGNNNTTYGLRCDGRAAYVTEPTITGLVADTRIGGVDLAYAGGIPVGPNAANGAMLCVNPTP